MPTLSQLQQSDQEKSNTASRMLAEGAVWALIEEARLTPKPGLVDADGSGVHRDMDLASLERSARALNETFFAIALRSFGAKESVALRESLSALGRRGEQDMLRVTGGVNTHRGAIWTMGLLCAGAALMECESVRPESVCRRAASLANLPDQHARPLVTHGRVVFNRYGARGARGEAEDGFPHLLETALPMLERSRREGATETQARITALLAIMATLDDTCLLYRGGIVALEIAKAGAQRAIDCGGMATPDGMKALLRLSNDLNSIGASPGGSADLLAAALFLELIESQSHMLSEN
jgi:triphosphoribosyl-dephospho-CoA synthase